MRLLTPALSSDEEEREKNYWGSVTQGGASVGRYALGYFLSGLQPLGMRRGRQASPTGGIELE